MIKVLFYFTVPLSVKITPVQQTVDVASTATFTCDVTGYPVEQITWYKDAQAIEADDKITITTDQVTLVIESVQRSDWGMYQCMATNQREEAEASAQLSLGGKTNKVFVFQF